MKKELHPVNAKKFVADGSKKGRPKKRWKKTIEKKNADYSSAQDRSYMEAWLQKSVHPGSHGKQARVQEDEAYRQHS